MNECRLCDVELEDSDLWVCRDCRERQVQRYRAELERANEAAEELRKEIADKARRGASARTMAWKRELLAAAQRRVASLEVLS